MAPSDTEIIHVYLEGQEDQFDILVQRYAPILYRFVCNYIGVSNIDQAEDITQEIFIKIWKNLKKFDEDKSSFKTWVFTIARNTIVDWLRKKKSLVLETISIEEESFVDILDESPLPEDLFDLNLEIEEVRKKVGQLPSEHSLILSLRHEYELTFEEIAEIVHLPMNTVKSTHRRIIDRLRKKFSN